MDDVPPLPLPHLYGNFLYLKFISQKADHALRLGVISGVITGKQADHIPVDHPEAGGGIRDPVPSNDADQPGQKCDSRPAQR